VNDGYLITPGTFRHHPPKTIAPCVQNPPTLLDKVIVTKYASRHWAVWIGEDLVAVTVYKKGARRVAELLQTLPPTNSNVPLTQSTLADGFPQNS